MAKSRQSFASRDDGSLTKLNIQHSTMMDSWPSHVENRTPPPGRTKQEREHWGGRSEGREDQPMGEQTDDTLTYLPRLGKRASEQSRVHGKLVWREAEEKKSPQSKKTNSDTGCAWGMCLIMHGIPRSGSAAIPH
jgi:hypothetical protein